jgi:hypothetical protein
MYFTMEYENIFHLHVDDIKRKTATISRFLKIQ